MAGSHPEILTTSTQVHGPEVTGLVQEDLTTAA